MSARKSRTSLGAAATGNTLPKGTIEAFEDFRRRHSRQNKDIIIENSLRRTTIKTLQDEVAALHVELLAVRQANLFLTSQVKRLQQDSSKRYGEATRDAIDQILQAVPALRQLRDTIGDSSPNTRNPFSQDEGQGWVMSCIENPTATRPAATAAAEMNKLETLMEASEYASDGGITITVDDSRVRRKSKGRRRTEIGSVAAPRSPRPPGVTRQPPSDLFVIDTIGSSSPPTRPETISPGPVKAPKSPSADRKTKRRRESGLLKVPPLQTSTPPPADTYVEISDPEDDNMTIAPPVAQRPSSARGQERTPMVKVRDIAAGLANDRLGSTARVVENTIGVEEGVNGIIQDKESGEKVVEQLGAAAGEQSRASEAAFLSRFSLLTTAESESGADDEGGRGRRARKSVNYKEPSLTKKMRKPDGVSVQEVLRLPGHSVSSASMINSEDGPSVSSNVCSPKSKGSKRALSHMTGPRRKSVLPRTAFTGKKASIDDDDNDDDDDDDDDDDEDYADVDYLKAVHDPSDEEDVPPGVPPANQAPPKTSPITSTSSRASSTRQSIAKENKATSSAAVRVSPRKVSARRTSVVSIGKPTGARIPTVASRAALKDRTADNGTGVTGARSAPARSVSASAATKSSTAGRTLSGTSSLVGGRRVTSH